MILTAVLSWYCLSLIAQTQTFTASGTFVVPAGVTSVTVQAWGGGGAGGGCTNQSRATGGGGAGGSYTNSTVSVTPGASYTVTVGNGGLGASAANGGSGGTSSFGALVTAIGGAGGTRGDNVNLNGPGATATVGVTRNGGAGGTGDATASVSGTSGGGGGGAGSTGNGGNSPGTTGGSGGTGGGGAGADGTNNSGNGTAATALSGGGSGGRSGNTGTNRTGGDGFRGQVIVTWACPTYSLTSTAASSPVCGGSTSTVTLTGSAASLPVGTYTVTYNLSAPNTATGSTATMTVTTAGTGTFTTSALANSGATTVTITNLASGTCTSSISTNRTAIITVNANPQGTFSGNTICNGASGGQLTLTTTAGTGPFTIVYNDGTANRTATGVVSGTAFNPFTNPSVTTNYTLVSVTDANGCARTSGFTGGSATITVLSAVNYGTITSADESFCNNTTINPADITFSAAPSGSGAFTYQWYYQDGIVDCPTGTSTVGWTSISGATSNSYNPPSGLANSRTYACFVTPSGTPTCGVGTWANSCRKVTELPALDYGILSSGDETICSGGDPASITFSTAPAGSGSFTYQWYYQDGIVSCPTPGSGIGSWISLGGSGQSVNFDPPSGLTGSRTYAVRVSPGGTPDCGGSDWANGCRKVTVNAFTFPQVSAFSGNTLCNGASGGQLTVTATGTGPFTVVYNDGTADRTATGVVSGTPFSPFTNPSATTNYTLVSITSANGCTRTSGFTDGSATITVQSAVTAGAIGNNQSQTACSAFNPGTFSSLTDGTGSGTITYRWERSTNLSTWTTIVGETNSTYNPGSITQTTYYRRVTISTVNGVACESVPTTPVSATVGDVTVSIPSGGTITCPGSTSLGISATISGASNPSYQWQRSSDGGSNWVNITSATLDNTTGAPVTYAGFTSTSLTITTANSAITGYRYRLVMTNASACTGTFTSGAFNLTVNSCPLPIALTGFTGKQVGNAIELKWKTESEQENAYMEVQRSKDGINFLSLLPQVKGHGTTAEPRQYQWTDSQPFTGINYYRLKQVDYDGKFEYHTVIAVPFNQQKTTDLTIYPTIAQEAIQINWNQELEGAEILTVTDMTGRVVMLLSLTSETLQQPLQVQRLAAGHYIVAIRSKRTTNIGRFVKK